MDFQVGEQSFTREHYRWSWRLISDTIWNSLSLRSALGVMWYTCTIMYVHDPRPSPQVGMVNMGACGLCSKTYGKKLHFNGALLQSNWSRAWSFFLLLFRDTECWTRREKCANNVNLILDTKWLKSNKYLEWATSRILGEFSRCKNLSRIFFG